MPMPPLSPATATKAAIGRMQKVRWASWRQARAEAQVEVQPDKPMIGLLIWLLNLKVQYNTILGRRRGWDSCLASMANLLASMSYLLPLPLAFVQEQSWNQYWIQILGNVCHGRPSVFHMKRWNQYGLLFFI